MSTVVIGAAVNGGEPVTLDVDRLIESRMLITANSGAGKSRTLRRLLEQTHGLVQHLVLDPEGEFHTLREKHGYVIAGKGRDVPARPASAATLARRLLELRASAVLDLYELIPEQRVAFVRHFLESLIDAPRELWRPVLVVIDEAHVFAPESSHGQAASLEAVGRLMSQGRKRGFAGVLATQRLSKLAKDVAAEANNLLVGRASLDVDRQRAGAALGFTGREERDTLRKLQPGRFYAFGPALSDEVRMVHVGPVFTSHPEAGKHTATPPAKADVAPLLASLAGLEDDAAEEARTLDELRARIDELERERDALTRAADSMPNPEPRVVEVPAVSGEVLEQLRALRADLEAAAGQVAERLAAACGPVVASIDAACAVFNGRLPKSALTFDTATNGAAPASGACGDGAHASDGYHLRRAAFDAVEDVRRARRTAASGQAAELSPSARRMLVCVYRWRFGREPIPRATLATHAGYSPAGGGFRNVLSELHLAGLVVKDGDGVGLTPAGQSAATGSPRAPMESAELQGLWRGKLSPSAWRMLEALLAVFPRGLERAELARQVGYEKSGGGFRNVLSELSTAGLVRKQGGQVGATPALFLDRQRSSVR